ncbi:hypothetical protein [Streptomyces sp. HUAS TT7]|uniref:hypothetical protein n=1 Tax=Streptomyces sp. HUAS TT7 TaxID=3447507 RepID=UPI003F65AD0B
MTETTTAKIPAQTDTEPEAGSQAPGIEPGHGGRIITALESAWAALRANHPDMPEVVMITGTARQKGGDRWGHFGADFWAVPANSERASELFIAGELIQQGGRAVMKTLIHEAAHAVAFARGIKDTSGDGNRYHNKRFVALAEELGLKGPAEPIPTHGWNGCTITDETAATYAEVIAELDAARLPYLNGAYLGAGTGGEDQGDDDSDENGGTAGKPKKKRRSGRRFAVICQCRTDDDKPQRRLQITPKSLEDGPLICGNCREEFAPEEPDEDDDE